MNKNSKSKLVVEFILLSKSQPSSRKDFT